MNLAPKHQVIKLLQPIPLAERGLRVVSAATGEQEIVIYERKADTFLVFAEAAWSQDEDVVAIFTCSTSAFNLAYDRNSKSFVPFTGMSRAIATRIKSEYQESRKFLSDDEVLDWACSAAGQLAYQKLRR